MKDLKDLEKKLNTSFKNTDLLMQAFCHRSYINENPDFHLNHNERLEFLGDAVLELVVTEHLFKNYSNAEGDLTNWRASLVRAETLAKVAGKMKLEEYLLLSKGEKKDLGKARQYILANTMEALLGAVYLDQGYDKASDIIHDNLMEELKEILENGTWKDYKSFFQEIAQDKRRITPIYNVMREWGPDHEKRFLSAVFLEEEKIAEGEGLSKQEAEQKAAENALNTLNWK